MDNQYQCRTMFFEVALIHSSRTSLALQEFLSSEGGPQAWFADTYTCTLGSDTFSC